MRRPAKDVMTPKTMEARAKNRKCGPCMVCDRAVMCGWKQGMLFQRDRPDRLGVVFEARVVGGRPAISAKEIREGALDTKRVNGCLQVVAMQFPVIVANFGGEVLGVLGEDARAREVLELIKGSRDSGDGEETEAEKDSEGAQKCLESLEK